MLIALVGQDGAGKSTQSAALSQWLRENGHEVHLLDKWDVLDPEKHPECRFLANDLPQLRVCIAEMEGPARAMFLMWSIEITMKRLKQSSPEAIFISDGYWIKHAAAEIVYGADRQWIENLVEVFPAPDLTFYFDIAVSDAVKRKHNDFTPYECGRDKSLSPKSFIRHQEKVKVILHKWQNERNWQRVDALDTPDDIQQQLRMALLDKLEVIA